jgi:4-coumarate--CoA ligase
MTKAKVLIAHPSNIDAALEAASMVGLSNSNVFVFGKQGTNGCLPYSRVFLTSERRAAPLKLTPEEAKDTVAYLCFSSGTTGKFIFFPGV